MTLIVGIVCKDGIVLASDSQATYESRFARTDSQKLFKVSLGDKSSSAMFCTAGHINHSMLIMDRIETLARNARLEHSKSFADLAENANRWVQQKERETPSGRTSRELKQHLKDLRYVLMIANYFKGKPHLFTFDSADFSVPVPVRFRYAAIGGPVDLANYLLAKFNFADMELIHAVLAAIYVIRETIQGKDSTCYYPIQVATVRGSHGSLRVRSGAMVWEPEWIAWAVESIKEHDKRLTALWGDRLNDIILGIALQRRKSGKQVWMSAPEPEPPQPEKE